MNVSYLTNVLNQRNGASPTKSSVQSELVSLKSALRRTVEENKTNVKPLVAENESLSQRTDLLKSKIEEVNESVMLLKDEIQHCTSFISKTSEELCNINVCIAILDRLTIFKKLLDNLKISKNKQIYSESAKTLQQLDDLISKCEDLKTLNLFMSMCKEVETLRDKLLFEMVETWNKNITISPTTKGNKTSIDIIVNKENKWKIDEIVQASLILNKTRTIDKFFNIVKENILLPSTVYHCELSISENDDTSHLSITINKGSVALPCWKIFDIIKATISFIRDSISKSIIEPMGQNMAQEVVTSLVKNSLTEAVLSPTGKLNSFEEISKHAEKFQSSLQELGFIPVQYESFLNETENTGLFFAEKIYLSYLDRARTIMKCDLHTTVLSQRLSAPNWDYFPIKVAEALKSHFNIKDNVLMESQQISKSALDVLDLVDTMMNELMKSDGNHNKRLMFAARNIFEMYAAIVPLHHAKLINTIPQQVAIFHNNCLHFSYRLILLANDCLGKWQNNLQEYYHIFLDQAAEMRLLAVESLEKCVGSQRRQILTILSDSGLSRIHVSPKLESDTDKAIRQCLRQLELLKNVWSGILAENVYANSMGFLIDEFTQGVVAHVTAAEDISQDAATELVTIFNNVEDRLPSIFEDPREIHRLCRKWSRFRELIYILKSNLDGFSERWASGLGPLAHEFSKKEGQKLVRALFRNTERRAAVLSQIYNS